MKKIFTKIVNFLTAIFTLCLIGALVAAVGVSYVLYKYGQDLPDHKKLAEYEPSTVTRLYAADGRMMEEYAKEKRLFVPINAIPKREMRGLSIDCYRDNRSCVPGPVYQTYPTDNGNLHAILCRENGNDNTCPLWQVGVHDFGVGALQRPIDGKIAQ